MNPVVILVTVISMLSVVGTFQMLGLRLWETGQAVRSDLYYSELASITESARVEILDVMEQHGINPSTVANSLVCFQENIDCDKVIDGNAPGDDRRWLQRLTDWHKPIGMPDTSVEIRYRVRGDSSARRLVIQVRKPEVMYSEKSIALRLSSAQPFQNAMTGHSFDCLFCHAVVYGDIAQYQPWRMSKGRATRIHGTWYSAGTFENITGVNPVVVDPTSPALPITSFTDPRKPPREYIVGYHNFTPASAWYDNAGLQTDYGAHGVNSVFMQGFQDKYVGSKLPMNLIRQKRILPKVDPDVMKQTAAGTLRAALMQKVARGSNFVPGATGPGSISGSWDGHLVLNGRDASSIDIKGRVVVSGDIIIFGKIKGVGQLVAGGNIYIADDLEYHQPPPHFDGSLESNTKMSLVSKNAASLAKEMARFDRVALMATNNILIGDPFYQDKESFPIEAKYATAAQFRNWEGQFAIDRKTGTVLDAEYPGGNLCFLKPWESMENCLPFSDAQFASKVKILNLKKFEGNPWDSRITSDREYYQDEAMWGENEVYTGLFLPREYRNGDPVLWIDKDQYFEATKNVAKHARDSEVDANGARRRSYSFDQVFVGNQIFNPTAVDIDGTIAELDRQSGAMAAIATLACDDADLTVPSGTLKGKDCFKRYLRKLFKFAIGDGSDIYPFTRLENVNRFNFNDDNYSTTLVPEKTNGTPVLDGGQQVYIAGVSGEFVFDPTITADPSRRGFSFGYVRRIGIFGHDSETNRQVCDDMYDSWPYEASGGTVLSCNVLSDQVTPNQSSRLVPYSDFSSTSYFHAIADYSPKFSSMHVSVQSRFWDPAKVRQRNRIYRIDGLLVANQFILPIDGSYHDKHTRYHGGLIAKDILGLQESIPKADRDNVADVPPALWDGRVLPSMWVVQDPRFQFADDLIGKDFLSVESISSGVE